MHGIMLWPYLLSNVIIEPPGQSPRASVEPEVTQQAKRDSPTFQNGVQTSAPVPSKPTEPRDEPLTMQSTTDVTQTEQTPKETLDPTTAMVSDNPAAEAAILEDEHPDQNGVNQKPTEPQKESSGADGTPELEDTTNGKRKRRGSSAGQRRSQSIEQPETEAENAQHPALQEPSLDTNLDESMVADSLKSQSGKRSRGRPRTSVQSSPAMDEGSAQNEAASAESMPGQSIPTQQQTTTDSVANETQNGQPVDEGNVPEEDDTANSEGIRQSRQKSKATNDIQKQVGHPGKKAIELPESMEALGPAGEKRKQRRRLASEPEPEPGVESEGPKEPKPVGEKRKRGRMSKEEPEPEPEQQPQSEPQNEPEISKKPKPAAERRNRRKRSDQEPQPEPEVEPELEVSREPEPAIEKRKRGRRARGERVLEPEPERQPEVPEEPEPATEKRKRRRRSDQGSELEPEPERETQAEPDPVSPEEPKPAGEKRKRGRRSKEERVPEPEAERQPEAPEEPEPEPTSAPKRSRGRPSLSHKGPEVTHREEDLAAQNENGEEASRTTRRKPRQPRGETVPVTVHRIANVASLGGHVRPSELSDEEEEEESVDELATRQKTKLPSRGGVNVADVLSQICRETLEKTLTTLKNGISNEGNAARRSEWTTKKKAVEAFGTELEGRLFELSEMLDSNFILGVKLKKAKREMMDMRSRLYQLRKERESVALQMDAVRRKHSEEENASQVNWPTQRYHCRLTPCS